MLIELTFALAMQVPDGAKMYEDHCAACHNGSDPRTPAASVLRQKTAAEILAALATGKMQQQGAGVTDAERRAVASFLGATGTAASSERIRCTAGTSFDPSTGPKWAGWSNDLGNTRFQPAAAAGMTADQVPKLTLKWAFGFPNATTARGLPTIVGGRVFVGSQSGVVYALDAKTGCTIWTFKAQGGVRAGIIVGPRAGSPGGHAAYFGDGRANQYAV